jgi:RNA polymerase sigma-70 factor (ECF subfamily)
LRSLSPLDREALLLVAWEDLTPAQAARSLGIKPTAFRVRLLRARRRLKAKLNSSRGEALLEMETT